MIADSKYRFREYASAVTALFDKPRGDVEKLEREILRVSQSILDIPDLIKQGQVRKANHVNTPSKWLYYDGHLQITISQMPKGMRSPVHDHGVPEYIIVYSGEVLHTLYERMDDQSVPGYADLKVIEERILKRGDIVLVMPPLDIHRFEALTDDTFTLAGTNGNFKPERCYYQPEQKTYAIHTPDVQRAANSSPLAV